MTTLSANTPRAYSSDYGIDSYAAIGADIVYEGAATGAVAATGYARPLQGGDKFLGFASRQADNSTGAAGAIRVEVIEEGEIQLSIAGAVITDIGAPVYATDDDTFVFSPVGGSFIGFATRYVEDGVMIVSFDAMEYTDPYGDYGVREAISANKTLDIQDNGKLFWVDTDAVIITMPATATPVNCKIVNGGAFGSVAVNISPDAADKIQGPDLPGTDDKDLINTKATARRGDFAEMITGDANGPIVSHLVGIWATEA